MKVDICIPAYNEEAIIVESISSIQKALKNGVHEYRIIVADNGSTDATAARARAHEGTHVLSVPLRGKGAAVVAAAQHSSAEIFGFADADLSADPADITHLVGVLEREEADIVVGSRLLSASTVKREPVRTLLSRTFNILREVVLGVDIQDTQCGLKCMNARGRSVLAACHERGWFFDIEFLARAEREGLKILEVPIRWDEHRFPERESKLHIIRDGFGALLALARIRRYLVAQYGPMRRRLVNGSILSEFSRLSLSTADEKEYTLTMTPFNKLAMRMIGVPHLGFRMRARIVLAEARKSQQSARMLDAGCGYGLYAMSLGESGYHVDAIDIDEKRIHELRRMFEEYPRFKETVTLQSGSLTKLPFSDETYDTIVCSEVIEHIPDDVSAVRELGRVLKPGGRLILTVPFDSVFNKRVYKRFDHQRPGYTRDALQELMNDSGLIIERDWYYEHTLGTALFNVFNTFTWKPVLGICFYPFYLLYLLDHVMGVGEPNQIVVTARKKANV